MSALYKLKPQPLNHATVRASHLRNWHLHPGNEPLEIKRSIWLKIQARLTTMRATDDLPSGYPLNHLS